MLRTRLSALLLATIAVTACTACRPWRPHVATGTAWRFNRVDASDFNGVEPTDAPAKAVGSVMLQFAQRNEARVSALCRAQGLPDAVAAGADSSTMEFAYVRARMVYTLRRAPDESPPLARTITEEEAAAITASSEGMVASSARLSDSPQRPRYLGPPTADHYGRVLQILARLMRHAPAAPAGFPPSRSLGAVIAATPRDPSAPRTVPLLPQVVTVAWVEPHGPAGDLAVNDVIEQVDDVALLNQDALTAALPTMHTLTVRRGDRTQRIKVAPEVWPLTISVLLLPRAELDASVIPLNREVTVIPLGLGPTRLPPGTIVLAATMALLADFDDDELAWVLGHEIAHGVLGHLSKRDRPVSEKLATGGLIAVAVPLLFVPVIGPGISEIVLGMPRRFRRDDESAADRLGAQMAARAGYDPLAGLRALERLEQQPQEPATQRFVDEHPPYADRRAAILEATGGTQ
ncbi:MAG: M48 family metalloprotease [bacterium]